MTGSVPGQNAHQYETVSPAGLRVAPPLQRQHRSWVVPATAVGVVVLTLLASGVITLGTIALVAPLAGCLLMHLFMGHGGHGSSAGHEGHEGHSGNPGPDGPQGAAPEPGRRPTAASFDPVCRMRVNPAGARAQGLTSLHDGEEVFFCSGDCKATFDGEPERYVPA